jgi:hypothetical protein
MEQRFTPITDDGAHGHAHAHGAGDAADVHRDHSHEELRAAERRDARHEHEHR